jgi:hypothetical protein
MLKREFEKRPALDMGGTFYTLAIKDGASEIYHLDLKDHLYSWTFIVLIGDWTGGELYIPQIDRKVPVRQGQVIAIMTRLLVHCTAPITSGQRTVFTCFSNAVLMKHGKQWLDDNGDVLLM